MRALGYSLLLVVAIGIGGCAADGKPVKTIVEEVCEKYGPASRECRDYRKSYLY